MPPTHVATAWRNLKSTLRISRDVHSQVPLAPRLDFLGPVSPSHAHMKLIRFTSFHSNKTKQKSPLLFPQVIGGVIELRNMDKGRTEPFKANNFKVHT